MRTIFISVVAFALVIVIAGCAHLPMKSELRKPISMTDMQEEYIRKFDVTQRAVWLLWGLVPLSIPTVDGVVGPHVADNIGVQNLEIKTKTSFVDGIITILTDGIITVRTVTIKGEVY